MSGRREFLRSLATLPLIGGSVALVGKPTGIAEPITTPMLLQYANWLFYERRLLCYDIAERSGTWHGHRRFLDSASYIDPGNGEGHYSEFHFPRYGEWTDVPRPSTRAAVVMAASGFDWRSDGEASL